jgi:hypothetical protein
VLERQLRQPLPKPVEVALGEPAEAGVSADQQTVLDSCRRAHRVVEDRPRRDIERRGERHERLGGRGVKLVGDEPEPSERAELQGDPELVRRAALVAHEREVLAGRREEPDHLAALDALRKRAEPLDLGVGEKPARRHRFRSRSADPRPPAGGRHRLAGCSGAWSPTFGGQRARPPSRGRCPSAPAPSGTCA